MEAKTTEIDLGLNVEEIDDILNEIEQRPITSETKKAETIWDDIISAIKTNNISFIKSNIMSNDIDIDAQNPLTGMTLLMYSTVVGNIDLVKLCCDKGADILLTDYDNESALDYAIKYGRYKITELLYFQQLSGELGKDLKYVAKQIHDKNHEAQYFIDSIGTECIDAVINYLCHAMEQREEFSSDLLYYSWYYVVTSNAAFKSNLYRTMMKTFSEIISNTKDRNSWKWLKNQFINNLIWYTTEHKGNNMTEIKLEDTLFYELLCSVKQESKKQSDLLLKEKINKIKAENNEQWKQLTTFNIVTKYSNNARQDDCQCIRSKYSQNELEKYPKSTTFSAIKHYDTNIYLNELLFRANALNEIFQRDVKILAKEIAMEIGQNILFRSGPLKTLSRSQTKADNDYVGEKFPCSARILDLNRCALQFETVDALMKFIAKFRERIVNKNAYCVSEIIRVKNGWMVYDEQYPAYTDIKLNVLITDDSHQTIIGEMQLLLNIMSSFKKVAHKLYIIERKWEFVESFVKLKMEMSNFKNNKNEDAVLADLTNSDRMKHFQLLWSLTNPNKNTLTIVNDKEYIKYPNNVALFNVITQNGKIFRFLTNENNINFYQESIQTYVDKYGFIHMIKSVRKNEATQLIQTVLQTMNDKFELNKNIYFTKNMPENCTLLRWDPRFHQYDGVSQLLWDNLLKMKETHDQLFINAMNENYIFYLPFRNEEDEIVKEILNHKQCLFDDIVFGYIRQLQISDTIPDKIFAICLHYFITSFYWPSVEYFNGIVNGGNFSGIYTLNQTKFRDMVLKALIENQVSLFTEESVDSFIISPISALFDEICSNKTTIKLDYSTLKSSSIEQTISHLFIAKGNGSYSDSLNWSVIFNLFKNTNEVQVEDLIFNDFLCEDFTSFISSNDGARKYKIHVFQFRYHSKKGWNSWIQIAKKYSRQMKQSGWLITASPPKRANDGSLDKGRVSFVKRAQSAQKEEPKEISTLAASLKEMVDRNMKLREDNISIQKQLNDNSENERHETTNIDSNLAKMYKKIYEYKILRITDLQRLEKERGRMESRFMALETEYVELKKQNDSLKTMLTEVMKEKQMVNIESHD